MISGALALFLVVAGHQYTDTHDIDPLIAQSPIQHEAQYMDVDDEVAPESRVICQDDKSKKQFDKGLMKVFMVAQVKEHNGASKEEIDEFVDAQIKHGMEVLHCHL